MPGRVTKNPCKDSEVRPQAVYLSQECLGKNAVRALFAPNQMKLRVSRNFPLGGPAELVPDVSGPGGSSGRISCRLEAQAQAALLGLRFLGVRSLVLWATFPFPSGVCFLAPSSHVRRPRPGTDDFYLSRPAFSFKMGIIVPALQVIRFSSCLHLSSSF